MTDEEPRPKNPTRAQLRQAVQPDEVMARAAEHWTGTLYMRRLSVNLTYLLVRTSITARPLHARGVRGRLGSTAIDRP